MLKCVVKVYGRMLKCVVPHRVLAAGLTALVFMYLFLKETSPPPKRLELLTKEQYEIISPSTYKHVFNQPGLCEGKNPFLVLMIPVTQEDSETRAAVRSTWGQENLIPGVNIVRLFFIGEPREPSARRDLRKENRTYGDIIQMDFLDTYQNLTVKTMMMMNWLATYCTSARFAMKIDADIFLNVPYLVRHLHRHLHEEDFITGSVIADARPRRDRQSKWFLPEDVYPHNSFPPYLSGAGYVFSIDLARKIALASRFVRPVPLEDVYVGLCLDVLRVRPVFSWTLLPFRNLFEVRRLDYDRCTFAKRIIVTGFTPSELRRMWQDFRDSGFTC
ncbi:beta-1,3-galactosyltransferase 2 [Brachyhypopomus gauderio]|uniref:beta-1,3-galactosyltransferase 2 n=1 Tax=Brachyhypopomus gauderio TaxID=698409 RepID=UPI00404328A3